MDKEILNYLEKLKTKNKELNYDINDNQNKFKKFIETELKKFEKKKIPKMDKIYLDKKNITFNNYNKKFEKKPKEKAKAKSKSKSKITPIIEDVLLRKVAEQKNEHYEIINSGRMNKTDMNDKIIDGVLKNINEILNDAGKKDVYDNGKNKNKINNKEIILNAQKYNDFYNTPDEIAKELFDFVKEGSNILDVCCGLLGMSKYIIKNYNHFDNIFLTDYDPNLYKIIEPLKNIKGFHLKNEDFILNYKNYYKKDIDYILCNPPFELAYQNKTNGDYERYKNGYLVFICLFSMIFSNTYGYLPDALMIIPTTFFGTKDNGIDESKISKNMKLYIGKDIIGLDVDDENILDDLFDDWSVHIQYIKPVNTFFKYSHNNKSKLGSTFGLYRFIMPYTTTTDYKNISGKGIKRLYYNLKKYMK